MVVDLSELIARLEVAKEGSRELDAQIHLCQRQFLESLGFTFATASLPHVANDGWVVQEARASLAPSYTTSLDAALTLLPNWCKWRVGSFDGEAEVWWEGEYLSYWTEHATGESWDASGDTFNPALSLCIAALKARLEGGDAT